MLEHHYFKTYPLAQLWQDNECAFARVGVEQLRREEKWVHWVFMHHQVLRPFSVKGFFVSTLPGTPHKWWKTVRLFLRKSHPQSNCAMCSPCFHLTHPALPWCLPLPASRRGTRSAVGCPSWWDFRGHKLSCPYFATPPSVAGWVRVEWLIALRRWCPGGKCASFYHLWGVRRCNKNPFHWVSGLMVQP